MELRVSQREPGHTPFALERLEQKLHLAPGIFKARLGDLHVVEPRRGIESDITGFHFLAHDLSVHLAFRRDINYCVIKQRGMAAEAAACF